MIDTYEKLEYITQNRQPIILCIDDDGNFLGHFKEELELSFNTTYSIVHANTDTEALEIVQIANEIMVDIAIVICDYTIGNTTGEQLLSKIHSLSPKTKTILIINKENSVAIKHTIENANLFNYIDKPIDTLNIKLTVVNAINSYENEKTIQEHTRLINDIKNRTKELKESNQRLYLLAATDPLTGINNRRSFYEFAVKEYATAIRYNDLLSVGIINIDNFSKINEQYGRIKADEILQIIAKSTSQILRISDTLGRVGGDEFAFLLPHTAIDGAKVVGNKICQEVENIDLKDEYNNLIKVTVSIGLSELSHRDDDKIKILIKRAEEALLEAKKNGKNRVEARLK